MQERKRQWQPNSGEHAPTGQAPLLVCSFFPAVLENAMPLEATSDCREEWPCAERNGWCEHVGWRCNRRITLWRKCKAWEKIALRGGGGGTGAYFPNPRVESCVMALRRHALAARKTGARQWPTKDHRYISANNIAADGFPAVAGHR